MAGGNKAAPATLTLVAAFAAVYVIWGSTYLAIRFAIETLPGFAMAAMRFLVAGAILYGWAQMRRRERPTLAHWRSAAIVGGLLLAGGNGLVVWAEYRLASGLAALLVGTLPLWFALLNWLGQDRERPGWATAAGLLVGFMGVGILVLPPEAWGELLGTDAEPLHLLSVLAVLLACLSWAFGSLYSRRAPLPDRPMMVSAMQMLAGGAILMVFSLLSGEASEFNTVASASMKSWLAWIYLVVFGSIVAFSAYSWLIRNARPTLVATYAYVNPVVAVILGWWLASEPLGPRTLLATALIVGSVLLVSLDRQRRAKI